MRAAAVKRKLWEAGGKTGTCKADDQLSVLVEMVSEMRVWMFNACVYVPVWHGLGDAAGWSEPGPPSGHSRVDINDDGFNVAGGLRVSAECVDVGGQVFATRPVQKDFLGDVAAELGWREANGIMADAEIAGSWEADIVMERGGDDDGPAVVKNIWCNGCWEVLPETCRCGALRWCGHCADAFIGVGGEAEHGEGACEVTMDMVRLELQRMAANVERIGSLGQMVTEMDGRLDGVREQLVTRDTYNGLLDRLRQLEGGVGSPTGARMVEQDVFDEHSGYTEDEGDVSDYGYFDGDGNSIPSEDEYAAFEG